MAKKPLLKGTLLGGGVAGGLVLLVGLYLTVRVEGPVASQLGLAIFMAFLAATVGGLVGPMVVGRLEERKRKQ